MAESPTVPTSDEFAAEIMAELVKEQAEYISEFGQIWAPIFPYDDLRAQGNVPNNPQIWEKAIQTVSLLTAIGPIKPNVLRCTANGSLLTSQAGPTTLTPYEGSVSSGSPVVKFFGYIPVFGVEVSNDGSSTIAVQLASQLDSSGKGPSFDAGGPCSILTGEKFSWAIQCYGITITCVGSASYRVQVLS